MSIFNFDNNKDKNNKKIIDPLQRLGIVLYHQNLKNSKQVCQMCGEQSAAGEIFNQLWCDDLP